MAQPRVHRVVEGDLGHAQVGGQVAQPPLMLVQGPPVAAGRDTGALDAQGPQQVADRVRREDGAALGRAEALGVEPLGDLRGGESSLGQFAGPGGQLGVVAELGQAGYRAGDLRGGAVPARPDDLHAHLLAGPGHRDADLLNQVADQLLAVRIGRGGSVPDPGQVSGQGPDLLALGGGQRPGAGGGEPVVLLAQPLPLGQRSLPVPLQLTDDQAVLRLGRAGTGGGPGRRRNRRVPGAAARSGRPARAGPRRSWPRPGRPPARPAPSPPAADR